MNAQPIDLGPQHLNQTERLGQPLRQRQTRHPTVLPAHARSVVDLHAARDHTPERSLLSGPLTGLDGSYIL
jgi:hypothetical protein